MQELIFTRETLHSLAELSGMEEKTSSKIVEILSRYKPDKIFTFPESHTVLAEYSFSGDGPTLLFRADIDAIAVNEDPDMAYASRTKGVSHKCGHDGHTTILLGLARQLYLEPLTKGRILLLFQAAEETGQGARLLLDSRFLDSYKIDRIYALHNIPGEPRNTILCREGGFSCSAISFDLFINGKITHAAEPASGLSPVDLTFEILQRIKEYDNTDISCDDYFLSTVIEIHLGEKAFGLAAGSGVIRMTFRAKNDHILQKTLRQIEKDINRIISQNDEVEFDIHWLEPFSAIENDPYAYSRIKEAALINGYPYKEIESPYRWGEDFGFLTQKYPGAMFGLGAGTDCPALHDVNYDFPNEILETGIRMFYTLASAN